jgi:hypothetical protein
MPCRSALSDMKLVIVASSLAACLHLRLSGRANGDGLQLAVHRRPFLKLIKGETKWQRTRQYLESIRVA